ncbi:hypothetical protein SynMEDNS5_02430 [Synechococcus sp. MEDNS5]|nr:hypothetical protein SynMEDNS5_00560 [Synechococcus sp. MEDNS5]QNJ07119.1 hypothetical protein SynMEDNS5_02430 [Synechococcus sp. MEDNS5]
MRSRQQLFVAKKHCAYSLRVFTSFGVVGVRNVEQQPDLRSWKVIDREI